MQAYPISVSGEIIEIKVSDETVQRALQYEKQEHRAELMIHKHKERKNNNV